MAGHAGRQRAPPTAKAFARFIEIAQDDSAKRVAQRRDRHEAVGLGRHVAQPLKAEHVLLAGRRRRVGDRSAEAKSEVDEIVAHRGGRGLSHREIQLDWPAMERGRRLQSRRAGEFGDRLRAAIVRLPQDTKPQGSAYGRAETILTDADKARQQLLFFSEPEIPTVLWVVIFVGAFLLFLLIAMHYAGRPAGRVAALGSVVTLLTVVVAVLSMLDQPYKEGVQVGPTGLRHAIDLINPHRASTGPIYGECSTARGA